MTDNFTQHSLPPFDINFNETYIDGDDTNDVKALHYGGKVTHYNILDNR